MENSRKCNIRNVNIRRAPMQKQLGSYRQLENEKQIEMIVPEKLLKEEQTPIKKNIKNIYNPKTLKRTARRSIKLDDK